MERNNEIRHYHRIGSDEELRSSYVFLREMERSGQIKVLPKLFDDLKQVIREYTRRPPEKSHIVEERGIDGYVELIEFDAVYRREYFPTYYDCTGQRFTNWVKFFQRRGRWMAYHSVSVDI